MGDWRSYISFPSFSRSVAIDDNARAGTKAEISIKSSGRLRPVLHFMGCSLVILRWIDLYDNVLSAVLVDLPSARFRLFVVV